MKNTFKVLENGKEKEYKIVKLCKNNDRNYIIYKDDIDYFASSYIIINNKIQLNEIMDNEWDYIERELNNIDE